MVEGNVCNCSCPTWKPTFCVMAIKCYELHHGCLCAHCHGHNKKVDTCNINGMCAYATRDICNSRMC
jgi:hypothetical protein